MERPSPLALEARDYFAGLQKRIIEAFEGLEGGARFALENWEKPAGGALVGYGVAALMKGRVFEKVGVNFSCVTGCFKSEFKGEVQGAVASGGDFWASGISLVAHMQNPLCPAVHFNLRRIETSVGWFGGGADLTPSTAFAEDTAHFHGVLRDACEGMRAGSYGPFKQACDEYFYLPHRGETRGVGGVFFDHMNSGDEAADLALVKAVGEAFLPAFVPIIERRKDLPFTPEDREKQLIKRGRYAEFNLLYDRGTRFGLQTGGNTGAVLMSLPPLAKW